MFGAISFVFAVLTGRALARFDLEQAQPKFRSSSLDGLRGCLAISVVLHHFIVWMHIAKFGSAWAPPPVALFNQLGAGAVSLFFMTTGFVFYPRILNGFRDTPWLKIFVGRVFRIVPMVGVSLAAIVLIIGLRTGSWSDAGFPKNIILWLTAWAEPPLLNVSDSGRLNAYVLWSLRYEWIFYIIVLPASALAVDLMRPILPSWTLPVGIGALSILAKTLHVPGSIWPFLPLFGWGMLAFELRRREKIVAVLSTHRAGAAAIVSLVLAVTLSAGPYGWSMPLFGFFFCCVACGNSLFGVLNGRGIIALGNVSYSIYLLHGIVLNLLFTEGAGLVGRLQPEVLPLLMPLMAVICVVLATITYRWVELPMIRCGAWTASFLPRPRSKSDAPMRVSA